MKLNEKDKAYLRSIGCSDEEFSQIEEATLAKNTTYTLYEDTAWDEQNEGLCAGTIIGRTEAIAILGRAEYLSGIFRSALHMTAMRKADDGKAVLFDSSGLFRDF